jgi:hypothetical protein
MTARDIILELARDYYGEGSITDDSLLEMSNDRRTFQRTKQLLDGYNTQKSQKSQIGSK